MAAPEEIQALALLPVDELKPRLRDDGIDVEDAHSRRRPVSGSRRKRHYLEAACLGQLKRYDEAIAALQTLDAREDSRWTVHDLARLLLRHRPGGPWLWTRWREAWSLVRKYCWPLSARYLAGWGERRGEG